MKFRKKPVIISAEKFNGKPINIEGVKIKFDNDTKEWKIWNGLHKSWIQIKIGDYFRTDIPGNNYPIDAKYMKENYEEIK